MIRCAAMKPVSVRDYFQVKRCYGASSMDYASLADFYLPLVGPRAFALFQALIREEEGTRSHEGLMRNVDLTPGEFEKAVEALEAVGLVRTFFKEEGGARLFVYCLYAPLHAHDFASDIMLSGTLKGKIGAEEYARLYARHQGQDAIEGMEEISASFPAYFKPSYDPSFYLSSKDTHQSGRALPRTGFDHPAFLAAIEKLGMRKNGISESELSDIEKIATLYSLSETVMAELAFDHIRVNAPIGRKVDMHALAQAASQAMPFGYLRQEEGESSGVQPKSVLAKKVILMDSKSPAEYLTILQNGHKPASADLRIIETLKIKIGLPDPCINALVEWALAKNDNVLSAAYCEKVGAAMVRVGCRSARDAMDYLNRSGRRKKKEPEAQRQPDPVREVEPKPESKPAETSQEDLSATLDQMLNDLYGDQA